MLGRVPGRPSTPRMVLDIRSPWKNLPQVKFSTCHLIMQTALDAACTAHPTPRWHLAGAPVICWQTRSLHLLSTLPPLSLSPQPSIVFLSLKITFSHLKTILIGKSHGPVLLWLGLYLSSSLAPSSRCGSSLSRICQDFLTRNTCISRCSALLPSPNTLLFLWFLPPEMVSGPFPAPPSLPSPIP